MSNWIVLPKNKSITEAAMDIEAVIADLDSYGDLRVSYDFELVPETRHGFRGISIRIAGKSEITPADIVGCLENIW